MNLGDLPLVLVVDDDPDQLDLARVAANRAGSVRIMGAESGAEAIILLDARRAMRLPVPDLVLTDLKMPEMNGIQLMQAVRERPDMKDVPVFFLTSTAYNRDRIVAHIAGAEGFFQKPIQFNGLVALMQTLPGRVSARGEIPAAAPAGTPEAAESSPAE